MAENRIEDALALAPAGPGHPKCERRGEPSAAAKRSGICLAPRREARTQREAVQRSQREADMRDPGERLVEGDTTRIIGEWKRRGAGVENLLVGGEHDDRCPHALGNARIGRGVSLVYKNLVIGEHVGERLEITPRIARGALGSNEHTVTGLPGNRTRSSGEGKGKRRHGARRRLSADDETTSQGVGNRCRGARGEEHAVLAGLAQT